MEGELIIFMFIAAFCLGIVLAIADIISKKQKEKEVQLDMTQVVSVKIIEETQLVRNDYDYATTVGVFGDNSIKSTKIPITVPDGVLIKFSITFKDGQKTINEYKSGTATCDRLLQFIIEDEENEVKALGDSESEKIDAKESTKEEQNIESEAKSKTETRIYTGTYIVGEDIDAGIYDIIQLEGNAGISIEIYKDEINKCSFDDYFNEKCRVRLVEGDRLVLKGENMAIRKAEKINI